MLEPIPPASAAALLAGAPVPGLIAAAGWPQPDTLDGLAMDLAIEAAPGEPSRTGWFIVLRASGEVIGDCGWRGGPDSDGAVEIGYGLAGPSRAQGYGTEAVGALLRWCTAQPGVRQVVAEVLPGNDPSRALLERLGFVLAGGDGEYLRYGYPITAHGGPTGPARTAASPGT